MQLQYVAAGALRSFTSVKMTNYQQCPRDIITSVEAF